MPMQDFSSSPLIDREQFDMLVATGEDDAVGMINELLGLYTADGDPKCAELHKAAAGPDRIQCNRLAHALAGASANLGCFRLSQLCRAYEHGAKEEFSQDELIKGAVAIETLYRVSVEAMKNEVAKIGKA